MELASDTAGTRDLCFRSAASPGGGGSLFTVNFGRFSMEFPLVFK